MSDTLFHAPAEALALPPHAAAGTALHRAGPLVRFVFRGDSGAAAKAGEAFGVSLPQTPLAAGRAGDRAALWQGPDEWLLLARPAADGPQAVDGLARSLAGELAAVLGDTPHSLVDVSERNIALLLEGPGVADLLNAHVFLDLDPVAFPVGMVTRTLFTKAEIVLWRTGSDRFVLECWRSFAPYVEGLLVEG